MTALSVPAALRMLGEAQRVRNEWAHSPLGQLAGCRGADCSADCQNWDYCELRMQVWAAHHQVMLAKGRVRWP